MQHNFPISNAVIRKDLDSSTIPVRRLERAQVFRYAILLAAFEVILRTLDTIIDSDVIKSWEDLIHLPTFLVLAFILFTSGVQENYTAVINSPTTVPQDSSYPDPSSVLVQKVDLLRSAISKATYKAAVEALHTLPDSIWNWRDLVVAFNGLRRSLRVFVSAGLKNYTTCVSARNLPPSTLLDKENSKLSAIFQAFESDPHPLSNVIRERLDMMNVSSSVRRSFHLFNSRSHRDLCASSTSAVFGFFPRLRDVFCHPTQLSSVFLDFCSIVYSFWDRTQSGPDFILPMSSLTRRPSARLSRLLVQHSRDLSHNKPASEVGSPGNTPDHIVALIDLNEASGNVAKRGYSTGADIYGLTSLLLLVMTLNLLFSPSWAIGILFLRAVVMTCGWSVLLGDGTLSLVHQLQASRTSTPAYAMLLDEDLTVLIRGTQDVVDAVTLGGFHLSYPVAGLLQPSSWNVLVDLILEGIFQGLWYLLVILPVWQFIPPSFLPSMSHWLVSYAVINIVPLLASLPYLRAFQPTTGNPAGIVLELVRMGARAAPLYVAWFLYIHDYSTFQELQVLFDMLFPLSLIFILSVPLPNYPVRTDKFLDVLGNPPVHKWEFNTPAAAATFQCLVLCHGIPRPVRCIDVRGVLDTVIPDQREVWQAWKARVADRVTHEEDILFSSTLPTFRDAKRQMQLQTYLDEAQAAYEKYRCQYHAQTNM